MGGVRTLPCIQSNLYVKIVRLGLAGCGHMHHPTIKAGALVHVRGHITPHRLLQGAAAGNSFENIIFGTTYIFRPLCIRSTMILTIQQFRQSIIVQFMYNLVSFLMFQIFYLFYHFKY